jgi:Protein of unknown function (DUF2911)
MRTALSVWRVLLLCSFSSLAQPVMKTPDASPTATVSQTVGVTEIKVTYGRPAMKGRTIWGQLVPYGEVWRAGANANTTVSFSSDVTVAGKPLRAGTYGLHVIPTAKDFTLIFSNFSGAWGSYTYDQKEDALRVVTTAVTLPTSQERLTFGFEGLSDTQATLVMQWDKLSVPVKIEVDTPKVVLAGMRTKLRGMEKFFWRGWYEAASYALTSGQPADEALKLVDQSIAVSANFTNQMLKAAILEKKGNAKGAAELKAKVLPLATQEELLEVGFSMLEQRKLDDALTLMQAAEKRFPESTDVQEGLLEVAKAKGDKAAAIAAAERGLTLAKDPAQKKRFEKSIAQLKAK